MSHWLRTNLERYVKFTDEEWSFFIKKCKIKNLKPKDLFFECNKVAHKVGCLKSGILRAYEETANGKSSTSYFYYPPKNTIVTLQTSFALNTPSQHCVEALTDCEILYIERKDLDECLKKYTVFETLVRKIAEEQYLYSSKRAQSLQTKNAKERINDFIKESGDLFLTVPQHMIASYLGISQFTLSKIKSEL